MTKFRCQFGSGLPFERSNLLNQFGRIARRFDLAIVSQVDPEGSAIEATMPVLEDAERLVATWNERQEAQMPMLFSPPVGAAIHTNKHCVAAKVHERFECGLYIQCVYELRARNSTPQQNRRLNRGAPVPRDSRLNLFSRPFRPPAGHPIPRNKRERSRTNVTKDADNSRLVISAASFGTRGSQVQILPLRPTSSRNIDGSLQQLRCSAARRYSRHRLVHVDQWTSSASAFGASTNAKSFRNWRRHRRLRSTSVSAASSHTCAQNFLIALIC